MSFNKIKTVHEGRGGYVTYKGARYNADYKYRAFLLTVPSYFQTKAARHEIVKRLSAKLNIGF